tara:strand:- start:69 stop:323 length:255 start_codon:yes stop_codon:yes gene_type:complete
MVLLFLGPLTRRAHSKWRAMLEPLWGIDFSEMPFQFRTGNTGSLTQMRPLRQDVEKFVEVRRMNSISHPQTMVIMVPVLILETL